jgi:hypothetical protein
MFCKFDIQDRLPILVVPGVLSIVGVGKAPATIPESQISSLQKVITSGMQCGPWPFAQVGRSVSVERGPLAGLKGIVIEHKSSLRLVLSLPLLQRAVAVEIDRSYVDFVPPEATPEFRHTVKKASRDKLYKPTDLSGPDVREIESGVVFSRRHFSGCDIEPGLIGTRIGR